MKKLISLFAVVLLGAVASQAQLIIPNYGTFTNTTIEVRGGTVTNLNSVLELRNGANRGLAVVLRYHPYYAAAQTGSSNIFVYFALSADGTNYTTQPEMRILSTFTATNEVVYYTNIPPVLMDNMRYIKLLTATNALGTNQAKILGINYSRF